MLNRTEQLSILGRILTIVACLIFGIFVFLNANSIKTTVKQEILPSIMSNMYEVKDSNIKHINTEFRKIISTNKDISTVVLYKFVADKTTSIYTGQINVTTESRNGTKTPNDSTTVVPMVDSTDNIQEILLNQVHYDNIATIQLLCENKFDASQLYSCEKYKTIDTKFKSVVSIPIVNDTDYAVVGYIMITLGSEYNHIQVQNLVNDIRPYLSSIKPLVYGN